MASSIVPPRLEPLLAPLLATLTAAAFSPLPPPAILPLLSPILRQRVQLLSSTGSEPWLPLLCYDSSQAPKLDKIAKSERLEAHPISGEVEIDWDSEVDVRYQRIDKETLQALVALRELNLVVKLVWCVNDEAGGGDGWRIGGVEVLGEGETTFAEWGKPSIAETEGEFSKNNNGASTLAINGQQPATIEEDDDDDYWAQYDRTPGQSTPAPKHSPAPPNGVGGGDDDSYYAQYASVQPAMDNHDPDEAEQNGEIESSLGRDEVTKEVRSNLSDPELHGTSNVWSDGHHGIYGNENSHGKEHEKEQDREILEHPRPASSSSNSTVEKLERKAEADSTSEVGIKNHIATTIKSLHRLAKAAGIEREEFERLVTTELELLPLDDD